MPDGLTRTFEVGGCYDCCTSPRHYDLGCHFYSGMLRISTAKEGDICPVLEKIIEDLWKIDAGRNRRELFYPAISTSIAARLQNGNGSLKRYLAKHAQSFPNQHQHPSAPAVAPKL